MQNKKAFPLVYSIRGHTVDIYFVHLKSNNRNPICKYLIGFQRNVQLTDAAKCLANTEENVSRVKLRPFVCVRWGFPEIFAK